ncbi:MULTISPECIES: hypothetical protein [Actinomadura]|uniref:Uncharacterized protein n=1 Tax=Actinomadura yumaensis TaxID=111807 RepID=A0ABW2CHP8_9ACTN|nr:hypothetical protein [Actinomadura sp. J1-007]MWK39889.1 hypothetical protein [Actinomadura sp. J1-007]
MTKMIKKVTVALRTSKKEDAAKILDRVEPQTAHGSRVFLGLAGRELRCSRREGSTLEAGSTETFVFGQGATVTSAAANDPTTRTMADVHSYPVYIRFYPIPNASDPGEDDWCLEHVRVVVESSKGRKVELVGLEGSARIFLGSEGGYLLYLQPGGRGPTVVRGSVNRQGHRVAGNGFTVAKIDPATNKGTFKVTFSTAFLELPIVVATIFGPYRPRANAHVVEVATTHAVVSTGDDNGKPVHRDFHFTATAVSDN